MEGSDDLHSNASGASSSAASPAVTDDSVDGDNLITDGLLIQSQIVAHLDSILSKITDCRELLHKLQRDETSLPDLSVFQTDTTLSANIRAHITEMRQRTIQRCSALHMQLRQTSELLVMQTASIFLYELGLVTDSEGGDQGDGYDEANDHAGT
jgi:hypothetical protein